ncbi:alpha/beta hydrolase [Qipengyuania sp. 6B39]|uniref:alpha/beta hydrolase n=1 Tax=Qipengyuania proteolytica TaxID=2867239 RepID=UPI001C8AFFB8|nr:alpha/beta hydrolase [Qipengyuania proteolytica]MBX7494704.1 alpha/beta hydrolase [Qipengyuania proteolytica]
MLQIAGGLLGLVVLVGAGLWLAIRINGAAVLDTVDRVAGGSGEAELLAETSYGPHPQQKLRVFAPPGEAGLPILVFVHGGSWRWGDPDDYTFVARAMADKGFVVVLAGYRLEDAGRYPAMLEDTAAAVGTMARRGGDFGGDPTRIVLAGHSAGAYNVAQVALETRWLEQAGVAPGVIKGVVGLAGPYDFYPFDSDSTKASFGSVGAGEESQPVNHARAGAPPMLLIHGEQDTLVKPRNTRALAKALSALGAPVETVFYPGMDHNAPLISLASPWRNDRDVVLRFAAFARRVTEVSVPVQAGQP